MIYITRGTGKINRDGHPTALLYYGRNDKCIYNMYIIMYNIYIHYAQFTSKVRENNIFGSHVKYVHRINHYTSFYNYDII